MVMVVAAISTEGATRDALKRLRHVRANVSAACLPSTTAEPLVLLLLVLYYGDQTANRLSAG